MAERRRGSTAHGSPAAMAMWSAAWWRGRGGGREGGGESWPGTILPQPYFRRLVWEIVLEVTDGGEHEGHSVGEHVVKPLQCQLAERHDDTHNHRASY